MTAQCSPTHGSGQGLHELQAWGKGQDAGSHGNKGRKVPRWELGMGIEGQAVSGAQKERWGKEGGRGSPFRGFTILPFRVFQPLPFFWDFFKVSGGAVGWGYVVVVPAFPLMAHRTAWLQEGLGWAAAPRAPDPSSNHSTKLQSSKSHGKWQ